MLRCQDGSHYTGLCTDPARRMREHMGLLPAGAKYTRSHRPVALDALWQTQSRSDAARLEALIKRLPKAKKLALINSPARLADLFIGKLDAGSYIPVPKDALAAMFPNERTDQ